MAESEKAQYVTSGCFYSSYHTPHVTEIGDLARLLPIYFSLISCAYSEHGTFQTIFASLVDVTANKHIRARVIFMQYTPPRVEAPKYQICGAFNAFVPT